MSWVGCPRPASLRGFGFPGYLVGDRAGRTFHTLNARQHIDNDVDRGVQHMVTDAALAALLRLLDPDLG
jgi:hypothetical protein